jgi:chitinase
VRFINSRGTGSNWSDVGFFTTDFINDDQNGNGIPDIQEVAADLDLDNDGIADSEQNDIKCVNSSTEDVQIGVSIKESENAASIMSMGIEDAGDANTITKSKGKPNSIQFGLINFKILVDFPGDETVVTIYLSRPAFDKGKLYKYDSINAEWVDYSDYAEFSPNRKEVYLALKDGGFGDADGIENGIIVDPLTVGTETAVDDGSGSGSGSEDLFESSLSTVGCFISTAVPQPEGGLNIWSEIRGRELAILFVLILFVYVGRLFLGRKKIYHADARNLTDNNIRDWILF